MRIIYFFATLCGLIFFSSAMASSQVICSPMPFYQMEPGAVLSPVHEMVFKDFHRTLADVAASRNWSKDRTQLTVVLKRDLKFNGNSLYKLKRNFNADDVVFSLKRQLPSSLQSAFERARITELWNYWGKYLKDVRKISDHEVSISFSAPLPTDREDLSRPFFIILSKEYYDWALYYKKLDVWENRPAGLGDYFWPKEIVDYGIELTHKSGKSKKIYNMNIGEKFFEKSLKSKECHEYRFVPHHWSKKIIDKSINVTQEKEQFTTWLLLNPKWKSAQRPIDESLFPGLFQEPLRGQTVQFTDRQFQYRQSPNYALLGPKVQRALSGETVSLMVPAMKEFGDIQNPELHKAWLSHFKKLGVSDIKLLIEKEKFWHKTVHQREYDLVLYTDYGSKNDRDKSFDLSLYTSSYYQLKRQAP